jgi:hypothetical protein
MSHRESEEGINQIVVAFVAGSLEFILRFRCLNLLEPRGYFIHSKFRSSNMLDSCHFLFTNS